MQVPDFVKQDVLLARCSTLGVGGRADYFAEITQDQVDWLGFRNSKFKLIKACKFARDNQLDIFILGLGSNVLFSDKGFRGLVLQIKTDNIWWSYDEKIKNELWANAGVPVAKLVNFGKTKEFTGFEFLAGLPGTVGGAIFGNAGCYDGQFWDVVEEVVFFDGEFVQIKKKSADIFNYRWSIFKKNPNWVILTARLVTELKDKKLVASRTRAIRAKRLASQPKARSVGCIFKNPEVGGKRVSAGLLIENVGLKGLQIGQAMISREHANFFVNLGGARASDFIELIKIAKGHVFEKFGVLLEEEIITVGEF